MMRLIKKLYEIKCINIFFIIRRSKFQGMNKYQITDMIDEGAYGIVWKATNKDTGTIVAIKEFKDSDEDEIARKGIQREIRMLKMLKGEYVVNLKEAFKKKNKIFLIFEYFPKNLLNLIEIYDRGLNALLINKIIYKTIKCLRFLHQKNIIHRDIKPQNILLQIEAEDLKLCDFGFARFLPDSNQRITEYVATRWYRSPELLVGESYGKAADVWAVGCILGELVDGQPMFPGEDQMDQIYLIRKCMGEITHNQLGALKRNPKFFGITFPEVKTLDSIESRYLGKIQKKALSFMKLCLAIDPSKRITVDEALKHPYLLPFSMKDNEHTNDETNLLEPGRRVFMRNESKILVNDTRENQQSTEQKTKPNERSSLKMAAGSLPQNSLYQIGNQSKLGNIIKKGSEVNLFSKNKNDSLETRITKKKFTHEPSPKLQPSKGFSKMTKVMSEEKRINYNIQLNINLKINEKLNGSIQDQPQKQLKIKDEKLPEIKNSNSKVLKYRLNSIYPGKGINTIYNSYGNLSILGEAKELNKAKKP